MASLACGTGGGGDSHRSQAACHGSLLESEKNNAHIRVNTLVESKTTVRFMEFANPTAVKTHTVAIGNTFFLCDAI